MVTKIGAATDRRTPSDLRFREIPTAAATQRAGETFSGSFTVQGGGKWGPNSSLWSLTFRAQGTGSAGTTFRINVNEHITTDGPGDPFDPATPVHVAFQEERCR